MSDQVLGSRRQMVEAARDAKSNKKALCDWADFAYLDGDGASEGKKLLALHSTRRLQRVCHRASSPRAFPLQQCASGLVLTMDTKTSYQDATVTLNGKAFIPGKCFRVEQRLSEAYRAACEDLGLEELTHRDLPSASQGASRRLNTRTTTDETLQTFWLVRAACDFLRSRLR